MFILIDLEATCWDKNTDEGRRKTNRNENEIIEIGAVLISDKFTMVATIDQFVRPTLNPKLSDFCTKLTTITQEEVDAAPTFSEAWTRFKSQVTPLIVNLKN